MSRAGLSHPSSAHVKLPAAISLVQSTAEVIERRLAEEDWKHLPGERALAAELRVGRSTVRRALQLLTAQGRLAAATQGRRRKLEAAAGSKPRSTPGLRIAIVTGLPTSSYMPSTQRFLLELRHALEGAGHQIVWGLPDLATQCRRKNGLAILTREHTANLWLVLSGTWEQLEFFAGRPEPALAIGGRHIGLDIASVGFDVSLGLRSAVQHLTRLGHRRIVFLCESFIRHAPVPGRMLQAFHDELRAAQIQPSGFNVPDWDDSPADLQRALGELFRVTPPTALIANSTNAAIGIQGFCNARRLRIPHDVSLVLGGGKGDDAWFHPRANMVSNCGTQLIPPILRWLETCAQGSPTRKQVLLPTKYHERESVARPSAAR